jgi:ankyrin repeat protein
MFASFLGWTPLMLAAENGHYNFCRWLLQKGANVNATMVTGWTAAHAATKKGEYSTLELLLQNGASTSLQASHRDFGRNLKLRDLTNDDKLTDLINQY